MGARKPTMDHRPSLIMSLQRARRSLDFLSFVGLPGMVDGGVRLAIHVDADSVLLFQVNRDHHLVPADTQTIMTVNRNLEANHLPGVKGSAPGALPYAPRMPILPR